MMAPAAVMPMEGEDVPAENLNIRLICKECLEDPPNLIEDWKEGTMVCASCGLVLMTDMIDYKSEWRKFQNDDQGSDDPSRVGDASNPLLNGSQLSTQIAYVGGDGRNRELQRAQNRANEDKNNKALLEGYRQIEQYTDTIGLPSNVADLAKLLYKNTVESPKTDSPKAIRGKSTDVFVAGCFLIACRQRGVPRSFKEITKLTNVPKKEIGRVFKSLEEHFKKQSRHNRASTGNHPDGDTYQSTTSTAPKDLCGRFGGILGLSIPISIIAGECAALLLSSGILAGRSPLSVAAAALYIISNLMGHPKTAKEVGEACGVSDGTIRMAWKRVHEEKDRYDIIQEDWIRKGGDRERLPSL